jgi:hypothetical protein
MIEKIIEAVMRKEPGKTMVDLRLWLIKARQGSKTESRIMAAALLALAMAIVGLVFLLALQTAPVAAELLLRILLLAIS